MSLRLRTIRVGLYGCAARDVTAGPPRHLQLPTWTDRPAFRRHDFVTGHLRAAPVGSWSHGPGERHFIVDMGGADAVVTPLWWPCRGGRSTAVDAWAQRPPNWTEQTGDGWSAAPAAAVALTPIISKLCLASCSTTSSRLFSFALRLSLCTMLGRLAMQSYFRSACSCTHWQCATVRAAAALPTGAPELCRITCGADVMWREAAMRVCWSPVRWSLALYCVHVTCYLFCV